MQDFINTPIAQYCFAGFCMVLLGIIVWLIQKLISLFKMLLEVIERNNQIIAALTKSLNENTAIVTAVQMQTHEEHKELITATYSLREALNKRRCMAE